MTAPSASDTQPRWMLERRRPRVIIIGGGFGGLYAARALKRTAVDVLLLDRTNHHLFQPLLYQVATATLAPTDITAPIRWLLRNQDNATVLMEEVQHIDVARHVVTTTDGMEHEYDYDYLIVATGARHAYFAHPEWETLAPGLKSIDDAVEIRRRVLTAFERAEATDDPVERAAWLTFVVVGGGPTGVELAGMLPTIARRAFRHDFRRIDPVNTRVVLFEGGPMILPSYPDELSDHARRDLANLGVDVRTGAIVSDIGPHHVRVGDEMIHAHTILWAAGNAASPLGRDLSTGLDRAGRVPVDSDLSVPPHRDVFVIGDLASITTKGKPVPGVAPAAMQMGTHAAKNIRRDLEQRERTPFVYRNKGDLATIGRYRAIADLGRVQLTGVLAWWFWLFLHIMYLAGFRNRMSVLVEWAYSYFTYERGARLITGTGVGSASREEPVPGRW
ncbi:MAG TPA: NAD(P)/FAD-dependent oxidoreductase [Gemmatimonadaceae bacterium]|jgi:NADH dehydrogenase|nr:NAD(P)/FAD-dependent oxidoreductase [Gemmatimonadaceae bacterium]